MPPAVSQMAVTHMTVLYICYPSVQEPLTRTQVVAYLEGPSAAGLEIVLLTFEGFAISREREAQI